MVRPVEVDARSSDRGEYQDSAWRRLNVRELVVFDDPGGKVRILNTVSLAFGDDASSSSNRSFASDGDSGYALLGESSLQSRLQ